MWGSGRIRDGVKTVDLEKAIGDLAGNMDEALGLVIEAVFPDGFDLHTGILIL